jgi:hypothetical protein
MRGPSREEQVLMLPGFFQYGQKTLRVEFLDSEDAGRWGTTNYFGSSLLKICG